jgi:hypothetical protein
LDRTAEIRARKAVGKGSIKVFLDARSISRTLDSDDPLVILILGTKMSAADHAARGAASIYEKGRAGKWVKPREVAIIICAPDAADLQTSINARPTEDWWWG